MINKYSSMTYVASQNPNSNYSNSQNPPSSYLNNQKQAPRVAQASTTLSPSVNVMNLTPIEILKYVWPDKMNVVQVVPWMKNMNPLVQGFSYGAWTQNKKLIYYRDNLDAYAPPVGYYYMPYFMRHEGQHINQFKINSKPKSFFNMLLFEVEAYSKTKDWVLSKGNSIWTDPKEYKQIKKLAKDSSEQTLEIMKLFRNITAGGEILSYFSKRAGKKYYKKNLEDFIKDSIKNRQPIQDELLAQVLQIRFDGLPEIKKVKNKFMIYTVDDLYLTGQSTDDKKRFVKLGYKVPKNQN